MNDILSTLGLSAEAKLLRKEALGGSDANIVMSGDEKKLLRLWKEKRGEVEGEDLSDILAVQMGSFTEPFNVAWFEKQTGYWVTHCGLAIRGKDSKAQPFMACTLDGYVVEDLGRDPYGARDGRELGIFEAKHCGVRNTDAELFARYVPQLTHNCLVAGERRAWLSCFKGNGDWVMFEMELDERYAAALVERERQFWEHVRTGTPPVDLPEMPEKPLPVGVKEVDLSTSNAWCSYAADLIETRLSHQRHEDAKKSLKELVEPDVTKAYGAGIELRRDKRGALRIVFAGNEE